MNVAEVAERVEPLLDEVERAVVGKREALELVLLGLLADGHVLIEDFPGLAKTLIARSFAQATEPRLRPDPVHARPDALRRHRLVDLQPAHRRVRVPARADLRQPPPRRRDQPRPTEDAGGAARGDAGAPGDDRGQTRAARRARSSCSRPRTRSSTRGRTRCPRRSSTASCCGSRSATRRARTSSAILEQRRDRRTDDVELSPVVDGETLREMQQALEDVHVSESVGCYIVDVVRATRERRERPGRREPARDARDPQARRARGRRSTAATSSSPTTSRRSPARRSRTGSRCGRSSGCSRCARRTSSPSGWRRSRPRPAEEP